MILIPFPEMAPLADEVAEHLGVGSHPVDWHHFPDGESLVTLPEGLSGADVAFVATLRDPDRLALPLRFAAVTARESGARRVGLVAPYLAYMRQDRRFLAGQTVSAPLFADFLGESFDWLVTVDPHLHRISRLEDVFPVPASRVATAPLLADWIRENVPDAVLFGPDSESQQWVGEVALLADRPYEVLAKPPHRRPDSRDQCARECGTASRHAGDPRRHRVVWPDNGSCHRAASRCGDTSAALSDHPRDLRRQRL